MEPFWFLLKGVGLGLAVAAPVGPIGVLCIRRTLAGGRLAGFVSGLGAATADAFYGLIAAFGITVVSAVLMEQRDLLRLAGGGLLLVLGLRTLLASPATVPAPAEAAGLLAAFASTFALTVTNPMTILSFIAIFAGAGLADLEGDRVSAALLVLGVFAGSALWWLLLAFGTGLFRRSLGAGGMRWVNRGAGLVLVGFGAAAVLDLV